jgi:hypothetical protein
MENLTFSLRPPLSLRRNYFVSPASGRVTPNRLFTMKTIAFLLLLAAPVLAHAIEIRPGDSLADVQSALGPPRGQAQIEDKLMLYYDRGQVQLVDGKVASLNLISAEEFAAQQAQHAAEGQALKAQKLADPNFASASSYVQFTFWADFRKNYPEVSCDDEYNLASAHWQADQQQIAEQQEQLAAQQQPVAAQQESSAPTPPCTQDTPATAQPQPQQPCYDQPQQQQYNQPQQCQPDQPPQTCADQQPDAQPEPVDVQPPSPPDSGPGISWPANTRTTLLPFPVIHR